MTAIHQVAAASKIAAAAGAWTPYSETWPGIAGASLPAGWNVITGTPTQSGSGFYDVTDSPGVATSAIRNLSGYNGTITLTRGAPGGMYNSGGWPFLIFRSDSTQTVYTYLIIRQDTNFLQWVEWNGGVINSATGSTAITTATWSGIRVTLNGTATTIELDTGSGYATELTPTAAQGLTQTYAGLGTAVASTGVYFGALAYS